MTQLNKLKYLNAAKKAAEWLVNIQDNDGKCNKYTYMGYSHDYHTKVAWPLLEVYKYTNNERFMQAAEKKIKWTLSHSQKNGWFKYMGFTPEEIPFTPTIAYTLRGLLESSVFLNDNLNHY